MRRRHIVLGPGDNVAVALEQIEPGDEVGPVGAREAVRPLHKISLMDIAEGEAVVKYGQPIGYATQPIGAGMWVHSHNLAMGALMDQVRTGASESGDTDAQAIDDRSFLGYRDPTGRVGTRNHILIASTVDCSSHVVELALRELDRKREWYARRYPNVDGIVGLTHDSGCGLVTLSPGHLRQNLTMRSLITHPNVAAAIVVQLGCEKGQAELVLGLEQTAKLEPFSWPPDRTAPRRAPAGGDAGPHQKVPVVTIQEGEGTWETVERIVAHVEQTLLPSADRRRRVLVPASELRVALQCGGSDAASGATANASIGRACDRLVACGASAFISETTETFGAEHLLASRAVSPEVAERYLHFVAAYRDYLERGGGTPQHNLSYGNKERGLTTIAEKSLGSIAKAGSTRLRWVVDYGELVPGPGLGFMNGPAYDPASATGQIAGGAQVGVFSTGAGSCFGGILTPWIKVVSNTETYDRMIDMEVNAGVILDGASTADEVGREIFERVLAAASGAKTYSEKVGYEVVNIWNSGTVT